MNFLPAMNSCSLSTNLRNTISISVSVFHFIANFAVRCARGPKLALKEKRSGDLGSLNPNP